jgi:uncharacterized protein (DUF697 family)
VARVLDRLWKAVSEVQFGKMPASGTTADDLRKRGQGIAPVVWLLGKTGAGKTAIVAAITGNPRAEIGEGFAPCTRTATIYDVPPEVPLIRFLDTRGLGEVDYDPAEDIAWSEGQSHLLLVAMQVADPVQQTVVQVVRHARRRHFNWPIVVAQTGLHRLYAPGARHPDPYPYTGGPEDETNDTLPQALRQALAFQRRLLDGLPGPRPRFAPIDFTVPEDGLSPSEFGIERLWRVLEETGLSAFEEMHFARVDADSDRIQARARPLIYGYGAAAASAGATPLPIVGVGGLAGILAIMLSALAARYDVAWTPAAFGQFTGAVGGGAFAWWALRFGFREIFKLIPMIGTFAAGALNAAAGFALTVGLGEAACVWLGYRRRGLTAPDAEVRRAFADGLAAGLRHAKSRTKNRGENGV